MHWYELTLAVGLRGLELTFINSQLRIQPKKERKHQGEGLLMISNAHITETCGRNSPPDCRVGPGQLSCREGELSQGPLERAGVGSGLAIALQGGGFLDRAGPG